MKYLNNERGIALVISLVALVIMGALVTAMFTPSYLERQVAQNARQANQAFEAAEYGLNEIAGSWNTGAWNGLAIGDSASHTAAMPTGRGSYAAQIRRINPELFLVDLTGSDPAGRARQRIGQVFRLRILDVDAEAALTTRGPTTIGGSAQIEGNDMHPTGWGCTTPLDSTKAGVRTKNAGDVTFNGGCSGGTCVDGNPSVEADSTMSDSTFFVYGDMTWADLVSTATVWLSPGTYKAQPNATGGACITSDLNNWGDPTNQSSPCSSYFPIIYQSGDMTVNGNLGQGIMLVEEI